MLVNKYTILPLFIICSLSVFFEAIAMDQEKMRLRKGYQAPKSIEDYFENQPRQKIEHTLLFFVVDSTRILTANEMQQGDWPYLKITKELVDTSGTQTKKLVFVSTKK